MSRTRIRRPLFAALLAALSLASAVLAGCGGDDEEESAYTPVAGTESAYCDTLRAWQVHELDGGEGDDQPKPAALKAYWADYLEFNATMLQQAPPEVRDEWVASERGVRTIVTPVLEKYGYDSGRIMREGTAAEKSVTTPPPDLQKAQDTIHAYEARVCGIDPPPAANVVFTADASSEPYCAALGTLNSELGKIESSRFDPDVLQAFLTSDKFTEAMDALMRRRRTRSLRTSRPRRSGFAPAGATSSPSTTTTSDTSGWTAPPKIEPCSTCPIPTSSSTPPARRRTKSRSAPREFRLSGAGSGEPGRTPAASFEVERYVRREAVAFDFLDDVGSVLAGARELCLEVVHEHPWHVSHLCVIHRCPSSGSIMSEALPTWNSIQGKPYLSSDTGSSPSGRALGDSKPNASASHRAAAAGRA